MPRKSEELSELDRFIGQRIQELRIQKGISRHELAEVIGVTHQQVQKYEFGTNRISLSRLVSLAKHLEKPVSYFCEEGEHAPVVLSEHKRLCLEVSRNFMKISDPAQREAVNTLIRTLSQAAA